MGTFLDGSPERHGKEDERGSRHDAIRDPVQCPPCGVSMGVYHGYSVAR